MLLSICTVILIISIVLIVVGSVRNIIELSSMFIMVMLFDIVFGFGAGGCGVSQKYITKEIAPVEIIKGSDITIVRYIDEENDKVNIESDKVSIYNTPTNKLCITLSEGFNSYGRSCSKRYKITVKE